MIREGRTPAIRQPMEGEGRMRASRETPNREMPGSVPMRFKPNYRFERAERERAKQARKDEKLKRQQERASVRGEDDASEPSADREPPET